MMQSILVGNSCCNQNTLAFRRNLAIPKASVSFWRWKHYS